MRRAGSIGLWWVPLLLVAASAAGWGPAHRDLVDFFQPMREATASSLAEGTLPWINLGNGCGEAWFANPETAVLYPPAWLHLVLPSGWAMTLEIALHLAWLSLGAGLLARRFGAGLPGRLVVEAAAWSVGPVIVTIGVLNNLETLAWVPWMVLAAQVEGRRSIFLVAVAAAAGWLGGEPQIWALAAVLTLASARSRARAAAGLTLGAAVVAVQLVPFVFWVTEGDRGPQFAAWALRGAVHPVDWSGVLVPGLPTGPRRMVYAESLFFGPALVLCALLGGSRRKALLAVAAALGLLATLPEIGGGGLFLALTGGLMRYPSRFALVALALLIPGMGRGADDWLGGRGRRLAAGVGVVTLLVCAVTHHPWRWWVAGLPAVLMILAAAAPARHWIRATVLAVGMAGTFAAAWPLLGMQPFEAGGSASTPWPEAADGGRLYTPAPAEDVMGWLASSVEARRLWPVGYLNLKDGLVLVRTDAPVANRRLAAHLETVDEGPTRRWWLDVLAANWVVLPDGVGVPEAMEEVRRRGGLRLLKNYSALPIVSLAADPPQADAVRRTVGRSGVTSLAGNSCRATLEVEADGWAWISLPPVRGWRWFLDGTRIELRQGPGILQHLPVAKGRHELEGRYRPPGVVPAAALSVLAIVIAVVGLWRSRRRSVRSEA